MKSRGAQNRVGPDALVRAGERELAGVAVEEDAKTAELRSAGQVGTPAPTWSGATQWTQTQALFGIVQGGMDGPPEKRICRAHHRDWVSGHAIGGLKCGGAATLTREVVETTLQHLPADKPRYLMGVGTPEEIVEYAGLVGHDGLCAAHAGGAAWLAVYFRRTEFLSTGAICRRSRPRSTRIAAVGSRLRTRAPICGIFMPRMRDLAQVPNTVHNLSFYLDTMRAVRHSIALGKKARFLPGEQSQANHSLISPVVPEAEASPA